MVEKYKLDNGLTVLLEPIDSVVSISAGLWIKTGSRHENSSQIGYAHLVEHMLFKGTEKYTAKEIANIVDRVGGQHNAATNREYTCYYINVISDYLELSVDLLSDMFFNPQFKDEELEKEKNVIKEEIRMYEDTPDELIHDLLMESMLAGHPLGHPIIGTLQNIKDASREKLLGFFDRFYKTGNAILVISGKLNVNKAKQLIEKYFSISSGDDFDGSTGRSGDSKRVYRKHLGRDLEQVHFCLGVDGFKRDAEDRWALYSLSTILGGSMSSRLFQNVRDREGLCYSIYSFHSSYKDKGVFGIYCGTSPENFDYTLEQVLFECRELLEKGITKEELNDARTFMKGNLALSFESTEVRMGHLAKNEMVFGRFFSFDEIMKQIDSVTMDDFQRVCEKLFKNQKLSLVSIGRLNNPAEEVINL